MTIKEINNHFIEALSTIYDQEEIQAIFRYYIEIKLNILDSFLFENDEIQCDIENFDQDLEDLSKAKPVQHVVGKAFFYDFFFKVNEHTLIPRPETEELIYLITEKFDKNSKLKIIDLGTGSGCIPITLNKIFPNSEVTAIDISEEALKVATYNNDLLGTNVKFLKQDLLQDFTLNEKFDIIISNPPYIRELEIEEMHNNVLSFEPHLALFVKNENPLIFYEKVAKFGLNHLNDNGSIFCEINQYLGKETKELFELNYKIVDLHQDISGNDRIIEAKTQK